MKGEVDSCLVLLFEARGQRSAQNMLNRDDWDSPPTPIQRVTTSPSHRAVGGMTTRSLSHLREAMMVGTLSS